MSKLKELEKRLKSEPHNFGLRVQVAGLMREAGRSTEAVELYRSVALAYRDQGRTQQAVAVCRSILEIAPDDVSCNALLSTLSKDSKPSIPSLTPPPPAGRALTSPTQPNVGRAPTRPSQGMLRPPSRDSKPPESRREAPPPARSRSVSDSVAPAPSRPASPSITPVAARPTTPSQPPPSQPAPTQQVVRNRHTGPSQPPDISPTPARQPFASGSEPRGKAPPRSSNPPRTGSQPPRTGSQPPRTGSQPPRPVVVTIPPKTGSQPPRAFTEGGAPGPAPSRPPTEPSPPTHVTGRLPLSPPTRSSPPSSPPDTRWSSRDSISQGVPKRRSSMEETPLPGALPHHVHDPTGRNRRVDLDDAETNPEAQRKVKGLTKEEDLARDLDTRPVRRIKSDELEKIDKPPPTIELARIPDEEIENTKTQESPPNMGADDDETNPLDILDLDEDTSD